MEAKNTELLPARVGLISGGSSVCTCKYPETKGPVFEGVPRAFAICVVQEGSWSWWESALHACFWAMLNLSACFRHCEMLLLWPLLLELGAPCTHLAASACGAELHFCTQRIRTSVEEEKLQPGLLGPKLNALQTALSSLAAAGSSAKHPGSFNSCALGFSGRQRCRNEEYHCVLLWLLRTRCVCALGSPRGFVFHQAWDIPQ